MEVSPMKPRTAVRITVATILFLISGAPSLLISSPETILAAAASQEIVIDNTQAELVGAWTPSTYKANYYKTDYLYRPSGTGANRIVWRPTLVQGGTYAVYYWLPNGAADRAPDATFTVRHATGTTQLQVDQRLSPGGTWRALGSFAFPTGTASTVELTDGASGAYVTGDAVKFVFIPDVPTDIIVDNDTATVGGAWTSSTSLPNYYGTNYVFRPSGGTGTNRVRWTPRLTEPGRYFVYYRLPDGLANRAPDATYVLAGAGATRTVKVDQRQAARGDWVSLGSLTFAADAAAYVELSDKATGAYLIADAIKFVRTDHVYTVRTDLRRQTILGLGVEIQSDSIGSDNVGVLDKFSAIPRDLTASERTRFYSELLKGFRYVRLAMGLYIRGLTSDNKNIVERYPNQMVDLRQMMQESGIEGASVEYWSPAPYWKSTNSLIGGSLKQFDDGFLSTFGDAVVRDLDYLTDNGIPISMFSLQNEPKYTYNKTYPYTPYTDQQYYDAFRHVAPKVRSAYPDILIHTDSHNGQAGMGAKLIQADASVLQYVDGWSWHRIGADSSDQITNKLMFNSNTFGRPVFSTEFEYLSGGTSVHRMVNTAQSIMNWFTFENAPTWFWLHALKPTYNSEGEGYALGLWRPYDDDDLTKYPHIGKGQFDYIKTNWHAIAGFVKYLPWNSIRYHVDEGLLSADHRIMAWRTPNGKLGLALTNRTTSPYTFDISVPGASRQFTGHRYDAGRADLTVAGVAGTTLTLTVPGHSIEFWTED